MKYVNAKINTQESLSNCLISLKCICILTAVSDDNKTDQSSVLTTDIKEALANVIIEYLSKGFLRKQDEFVCCKVIQVI